MFTLILLIYGEKKNIKKYVSKFIELHDCKFDKKKSFCNKFRKLNS